MVLHDSSWRVSVKHRGSIGGIYNLNGWELSKNRIPGRGYI